MSMKRNIHEKNNLKGKGYDKKRILSNSISFHTKKASTDFFSFSTRFSLHFDRK